MSSEMGMQLITRGGVVRSHGSQEDLGERYYFVRRATACSLERGRLVLISDDEVRRFIC